MTQAKIPPRYINRINPIERPTPHGVLVPHLFTDGDGILSVHFLRADLQTGLLRYCAVTVESLTKGKRYKRYYSDMYKPAPFQYICHDGSEQMQKIADHISDFLEPLELIDVCKIDFDGAISAAKVIVDWCLQRQEYKRLVPRELVQDIRLLHKKEPYPQLFRVMAALRYLHTTGEYKPR